MATLLKEIVVGNAVGTWYLRLYEDNIIQDIATNISTVYWRLTLRCSVVGASISFDNRDAWINTSHFTPAYSHSGAEHNLGTGSALIGHNADGTGSYTVGFGISTSYALNGSSTGGRTLPTIPRASSFTLSGSTLGSAVIVNIVRASSSFTHTVRYQFGNIVREYTGQSTSCTFTPPLTDASQIPNETSGVGSVSVYTLDGGGNVIGSKLASITLNLPSSALPTFSSLGITRVDNGVPTAWGIYVQGKSKATLSINGATGIYGSAIKSYSISGGGYSTTATSFTSGVLPSGTVTFTATITDSRGRSASKSVSITVYEYTPPTLNLKAERCISTGVSSNTGTYIKITPTYSCASVNAKNTITSKSFKITGTSYVNTAALSGAGFVLGNNDITVSKSYEVTGVVSDALGQSSGTITFKVSSSAVPLNLRNDGTGVAFGKYAETANQLESAWSIKAPLVEVSSSTTAGDSNLIAFYQVNKMIANFTTAPNNTGIRFHTYNNGAWATWIDFLYNSTNFHAPISSTGSITTSDWFYTNGENGWFNTKYGGGIRMTDSVWIRTYGAKKLYVDNTSNDAIYTAGGFKALQGSWLASHYLTTGWHGFYNANDGTRKGWIGHDGGANFNFFNETSGGIHYFNRQVKAPEFWDDNIGGYCVGGKGIRFLRHVQDGKYMEIGTLTQGAFGIYYTVSDRKYKKEIQSTSINNALGIINQLEHVQFDWIDGGDHVDVGYVANDVKDIMPGLVFNVKQPDGSDQYNINQTTLLPLITLGMQEQSAEIELLKKENQQLRSDVQKMEHKLSQLEAKIDTLIMGELPRLTAEKGK